MTALPLPAMRIVANVRKLNGKLRGFEPCLGDGLLRMMELNEEANDKLINLADRKFHSGELFTHLYVNVMRPSADNFLTRKIWFDVRLPAFLKVHEADVFLSFEERGIMGIGIPQITTVLNSAFIRRNAFKYFHKASAIITGSDYVKHMLTGRGIAPSKIHVIYPFASTAYQPLSEEMKREILEKYSGSKEYFYCAFETGENADPINLLKAFSYFKKRQQSGFKLILSGISKGRALMESLKAYKYREDVIVLSGMDKNEKARLVAAAYATIHTGIGENSIITLLEIMQSGVPVIMRPGSVAKEIAYDEILLAEISDPAEIGNKMMRLYTDEQLRARMIEAGIARASAFDVDKTATLLRQAIETAVKAG
jgi:glycosyltransferase involved in cell wall biosynthesis